MKGILYYFSGTGNTKWTALKFKEVFLKFGYEVELRSIEKIDNLSLEDKDFLIIGTPVHSEFPPKIIIDFLKRLPEGNNMKTLIYSTQGVNSAAAVEYIKRIISDKHYNVSVQASIRFANNYYFGFGIERTPEEIKKFLINAERKISLLVEEFVKDSYYRDKISNLRLYAGKVMHKSFYKMLPKLSSNLTAAEECTKCGLCIRNCPTGNITLEDGQTIFHKNCIMCVRCIHLCPHNAIRYKRKKINQIQKDFIKTLDLR
jgi:ferredoxin